MLINAGADPNIAFETRDEDGYFKNVTALILSIRINDVNAVKMLINAGANVNAIAKINNVDYTVLDLAKEIGNKTIINMLVSAGAK